MSELCREEIRWSCWECNKKLKAPKREIGDPIECPGCYARQTVPARSTRPPRLPMAMAAPEDGGTVPVNLGLPKLGSLQTKVTQKTADNMASSFLGGILVAIGVILAGMIGGKRT